jgi:hypothetical protein
MKGRDSEETQRRDIAETADGKGGEAVGRRKIHKVSETRMA